MITQDDFKIIKQITEEFLDKMTIKPQNIEVNLDGEVINISLKLDEPQILIGERGQTISELQRIMRLFLNKKMQKVFYLNLDINDYKNKKIDYLKSLAKTLADEVVFDREEKILNPMPAYERRIIHAELSKRSDVATESRGSGPDRYVVIKPK